MNTLYFFIETFNWEKLVLPVLPYEFDTAQGGIKYLSYCTTSQKVRYPIFYLETKSSILKSLSTPSFTRLLLQRCFRKRPILDALKIRSCSLNNVLKMSLKLKYWHFKELIFCFAQPTMPPQIHQFIATSATKATHLKECSLGQKAQPITLAIHELLKGDAK